MQNISTRQAKIAVLNDEYRSKGTRYTVTPGALHLVDFNNLVQAVRSFKDFNDSNDPYGEHDFGSIDWYGSVVFWKIDYYDSLLSRWHDPLDPKCTRVLTIMLAEEY